MCGLSLALGASSPVNPKSPQSQLKPAALQRSRTLPLAGLLASLLMLPLLGYWAAQAEFGTPVVQDWLPKSADAIRDYDVFRQRFGEDQFLVVSWPSCTWDDPRLTQLASGLEELAINWPELEILGVVDSLSSVAGLVDKRSGISLSDALERLRGVAVGMDGEGFISLRLAAGNAESYQPMIDAVKTVGMSVPGLENTELILAGEPLQVAIIDRSSRDTISRYVLPSSIGALFVAWLCLRSFRLTGIVFAFAGMGQLVGLSLIAMFLGQMSALLVVLPTLVFMLVLSAAIHLTSYYVELGGESNHQAGVGSIKYGFRPCALATITTAFGFGSLAVSKLAPVWHFGSLAAGGLLLATTILLSGFGEAVQLQLPERWLTMIGRLMPSRSPRDQHRNWEQSASLALAAFCQRASQPLSLLAIALLAVSLIGIPRLRTSTEFEDMFLPDSPAIQSLNWVRQHLGPINSLEVVVEIPQAESVGIQTRIDMIQSVHAEISQVRSVASVSSAATFLPALGTGSAVRSVIRRAVVRTRIEAALPTLENSRLLYRENGAEHWRFTAKIAGLTSESYESIYQAVQAASDRGIARFPVSRVSRAQESSPTTNIGPTVQIGGLRTVIESAHTSLMTDLGTSFLTAFLLITPVMMLIVGRFWGGLLLMIPNTIPVAVVFGTMGWLGVKLDVASILTASVALGIAVDDTLHFVNWYLRRQDLGDTRSEAVSSAIVACARPMLHTSIICTGAMLPFLFCEFLPTSKFALLMILTLSGAILGDLILLPALLLSPLGTLVSKRKA